MLFKAVNFHTNNSGKGLKRDCLFMAESGIFSQKTRQFYKKALTSQIYCVTIPTYIVKCNDGNSGIRKSKFQRAGKRVQVGTYCEKIPSHSRAGGAKAVRAITPEASSFAR